MNFFQTIYNCETENVRYRQTFWENFSLKTIRPFFQICDLQSSESTWMRHEGKS